ncbi:hypothetical protein [Microvirga roseola]|uniref:hypothetical protein n=1 Tax=Microvirga roseola TaxID=2883126 RepID=UPI001E2B11B6|nr:hypothetical protein [Microvirga roseola]
MANEIKKGPASNKNAPGVGNPSEGGGVGNQKTGGIGNMNTGADRKTDKQSNKS